MKLKDILTSYDALQDLSNKEISLEPSFEISKLLVVLGGEREAYLKAINKKLKDYGDEVKDKDGKPIIYPNGAVQFKIREENVDKYNKEVEELQAKDIKFKFNKIKLSTLGVEKIQPNILSLLTWLIEK